MPSGQRHVTISIFVLMTIDAIFYINPTLASLKSIMLFNIAFLFGTLFISPDLDVNSSVYKRWGLLKWLWWPYRELMKHRQKSHSFFWGPVLLIGYLLIFTLPYFYNNLSMESVIGYSQFIEIPVLALIIVIYSHIVADKVF